MMVAKRSLVEENESARMELKELVASLDEQSFGRMAGSSWTVSTTLCHLAFWDQRALFLLKTWENSGFIEPARPSPQSADSINHAVGFIAKEVPGPLAAKLALDAAAAVDAHVAALSAELVDQLVTGGFERFLRRSLHRREHMQRIKEALHGRPARA